MDWEQRVALVTGGSRGIGRATAIRLAHAGLSVAVNFHGNRAAAEETVEYIHSFGGQATSYQADVSQVSEAQQLVETVHAHYGRVDVLVNNAGITRDNLLLRMKPEEWDKVIATNLTSVYACTRAAVKYMVKARFGRIVSISSIAPLLGNPGQANYSAAKAGIIGFTRSLAHEIASRQITCNVVAPGIVETDITREMPEAAYDAVIKKVPLGRAGRPQEIADAVWFMIQSDYITGQTLVVDGGLVMD